jgi:hypothetical protein
VFFDRRHGPQRYRLRFASAAREKLILRLLVLLLLLRYVVWTGRCTIAARASVEAAADGTDEVVVVVLPASGSRHQNPHERRDLRMV